MPADSGRDDHWDFMLEVDDGLATWEISEPIEENKLLAATRLADHRKHYLDYEGPVSGNRGEVARWDFGEYQTISRHEIGWTVELYGQRLKGRVSLSLSNPATQRWLISLLKI